MNFVKLEPGEFWDHEPRIDNDKLEMLRVYNDNELIKASNFWGHEFDKKGYFYISYNASAVRLLVPTSQNNMIGEMRTGKKIFINKGFMPDMMRHMVEVVFFDGTDNPFTLILSEGQLFAWPIEHNNESYNFYIAYKDGDTIKNELIGRCRFMSRKIIPVDIRILKKL